MNTASERVSSHCTVKTGELDGEVSLTLLSLKLESDEVEARLLKMPVEPRFEPNLGES